MAAVGLTCVRIGAQTASLPTVDQILDKYIAASGGRAAIEKVTSISAKGTIDIPDVGATGTVELLQKAPDKALTTVDLGPLGVQHDGFDGTIGWADDMQNGLRQKSGDELTEAKRAAIFGRELKMKTVYPTMTVKGHEAVNGKDAYIVEATPASGAAATLYFDAASGLMIRQIVTRSSPGGAIEVDVTFSDFRDIEGVKRPFAVRQQTAMFTATIKFSEIKQNTPIDDAVFKMPK
jgi:hypothetical protein